MQVNENVVIIPAKAEQKQLLKVAAYCRVRCESEEQDMSLEKGKVQLNHSQFLGYTKDKNGNLIIVEDEAKTVRLIFDLACSRHNTLSNRI